MEFEARNPTPLKTFITDIPDDAADLIESLLSLDPNRRPSAE
jgi:hypothetical protein